MIYLPFISNLYQLQTVSFIYWQFLKQTDLSYIRMFDLNLKKCYIIEDFLQRKENSEKLAKYMRSEKLPFLNINNILKNCALLPKRLHSKISNPQVTFQNLMLQYFGKCNICTPIPPHMQKSTHNY